VLSNGSWRNKSFALTNLKEFEAPREEDQATQINTDSCRRGSWENSSEETETDSRGLRPSNGTVKASVLSQKDRGFVWGFYGRITPIKDSAGREKNQEGDGMRNLKSDHKCRQKRVNERVMCPIKVNVI